MRICCVSDVHIKRSNDEAARLFHEFLKRAESFDHVVLLGDIFDLLVGGASEWVERFPETFEKLGNLSRKTKVHYIEGNHDFNIRRLFEYPLLGNIEHYNGDLILKQNGKDIRFSHGDDVEIDNPTYRRYKKIIKNRFIEMLATEFVPVKIIAGIGEYASNESAKRSKRYEVTIEQQNRIQDKFRRSADDYYNKVEPFQVLVCGHSHVKDNWQSELGFRYVNNGYFLKEKTFAVIEDGKVRFESLV